MIVSCWEPDQLAPGITTAVRIWARFITLRAECAQAQPKQRPRKAQAAERMP
jgi:hypothetical protein